MYKWEKSLKQATVISNTAAAFNRCFNKLYDDMQDHIRHLSYDMIGKGKSSKKTEKVLTELIDLSALKSMQHMAETIFFQAANMTLLCHD